MKSRGRLATVAVFLLLVLGTADLNLAGGGFVRKSPVDPRVVDISRKVRDHCTEKMERRFPDGSVIEVMHSPEGADLAARALGMMERLRNVLGGDLQLEVRPGARVYLVELGDYPPSLSIWDDSRLTAVFALLDPSWSEEARLYTLEKEIYGLLSHEWTHAALEKRFRKRSAVERVRWISEGAAGYFADETLRALSQERFHATRALRLPFFRLEDTSLESLCTWKYESVRPADLEADPTRDALYGASLGLFLRVAEHGGTEAVWRLLEEFGRLRKPGPEETDEVLQNVTGRRFASLAAIPASERERMYGEALAALRRSSPGAQHHGLAVLSEFPERSAGHIAEIRKLVTNADALEGIRAEAARLLAVQASSGIIRSALDAVQGGAGSITSGRVELPLVTALAEKEPGCALGDLLRLASSEDRYTSEEAQGELRKLAGKEMTLPELREWVRKESPTCSDQGITNRDPKGD